MHILAFNGRPAMKCWEWQQNKQFPHSNCNFVIRIDSSVDGKIIRQKSPKSSGTLLGRLPLNKSFKSKKINYYKNKLNHSLQIAKGLYYKKKLNNIQSNTRATWKVLHDILNRSKRNSSRCSTSKADDREITDPVEIANKVCSYFSSIGPDLARGIQ